MFLNENSKILGRLLTLSMLFCSPVLLPDYAAGSGAPAQPGDTELDKKLKEAKLKELQAKYNRTFLDKIQDAALDKATGAVEGAFQEELQKWLAPHIPKFVGTVGGSLAGVGLSYALCGPANVDGQNDGHNSTCHNLALGAGAFVGTILGWGVPEFKTDAYWAYKQAIGYTRPPKGLEKVEPYDEYSNPDGAIEFEKLLFDKTDPSTGDILALEAAMTRGDSLTNGIFYGDAGTGKSSFVRSFSHNPDFEVYSVSGSKMEFEDFKVLTKWLKSTAKRSGKKILLDISEGDRLLKNIATTPEFKDYFKQQFESESAHYAIVFSCNFTDDVHDALAIISEDNSLRRRMGKTIRFSVPSPSVRAVLLKRGVIKAIDNVFAEDEEAQTEALRFFAEEFFGDKTLMRDVFLPNTEGKSHNRINTLAHELVGTYKQALKEKAKGLDPEIVEFAYLNPAGSVSVKEPIDVLVEKLQQGPQEKNWLREEREKRIQKSTEDLLDEIPLLKLKARRMKYLRAINEGVFNDEEGEDESDQEDSRKKNLPLKLGQKKQKQRKRK